MLKRECKPLKSNSFFLLGTRGTGKSTLLRNYLPKERTYYFDLLDPEVYADLAREPNRFYESVKASADTYEWFVVDEVQKLPRLLDSVHRLIFEKMGKFAITGSSARKLRRGGANLLAGRAFLNYLFPLSATEIGTQDLCG